MKRKHRHYQHHQDDTDDNDAESKDVSRTSVSLASAGKTDELQKNDPASKTCSILMDHHQQHHYHHHRPLETPIKKTIQSMPTTPATPASCTTTSTTTATPDSIESQLLPSTEDVNMNVDHIINDSKGLDQDDATSRSCNNNVASSPGESVSSKQLPSTEDVAALVLFTSSSSSMNEYRADDDTIPMETTTRRRRRCAPPTTIREDRIVRRCSPSPAPPPSLPRFYILCDIIPSTWERVLEQWQSNGTCVILESLGTADCLTTTTSTDACCSASSSSSSSSSSLMIPPNLIYMPYCYNAPNLFHTGDESNNRTPINNNSSNDDGKNVDGNDRGVASTKNTVLVCYRTFHYVMAKALGIPIVSPLGNLQNWIESNDDDTLDSIDHHDSNVWGDHILYQQVVSLLAKEPTSTTASSTINDSTTIRPRMASKYAWLPSAEWWGIRNNNRAASVLLSPGDNDATLLQQRRKEQQQSSSFLPGHSHKDDGKIAARQHRHQHDQQQQRQQSLLLQNYSFLLLESSNPAQDINSNQAQNGLYVIDVQDDNNNCVHGSGGGGKTPNALAMSHHANLLSNQPEMFHMFSEEELARLCRLTGADVFVKADDIFLDDWLRQQQQQRQQPHHRAQRQRRQCLLLVHDLEKTNEQWAQEFCQRVRRGDHPSSFKFLPFENAGHSGDSDNNNNNNNNVNNITSFSPGPQQEMLNRSTTVAVVRYTWLVDSICANLVAPYNPYCIGLLLPLVETLG